MSEVSSKEILEKAIQKAIDGGWSALNKDRMFLGRFVDGDIVEANYNLIFNHDFAKALWGDSWKEDCKTCGFTHYMYDKDQYDDEQADPYIYHLQQMVIAQDPIKYLGEHLDD